MPFKSQAQRRWAHTAEGIKALGGEDKVAEWEAATPQDAKLPYHVKPSKSAQKLKAKFRPNQVR